MLQNTGYLETQEQDGRLPAENGYFTVCSAGRYRLLTLPRFETVREQGRPDWQLLYVAGGAGRFYIGGEERTVTAGNAVLYRPWEPQLYYYLLEDAPDIYWMHFCGSGVPELLASLEILEAPVFHAGDSARCTELFETVIRELQVRPPAFQQMSAAVGQALLARAARGKMAAGTTEGPIQAAIEEMHRSYRESFTIEDYAHKHHMSVCWFIRSFKAYTGLPPRQFLTGVRIDRARSLLTDSSLSIGEVATLSGYDNPLYFSRSFKKSTGLSPSEYRKRALT